MGRFASNDGMVFPNKEQGMNRMMYVEGNPTRFLDMTGNQINQSLLLTVGIYMLGKDFGLNGRDLAMLTFQAY